MSTPREELDELFAGGRDDDSEIQEYEASASDVEDTDDGGAIVKIGEDDEPKADETDFYSNLVETDELAKSTLDKLATDLLELIKIDIEDREPRDKQYEEGLKRTGMSGDAPGGASFPGASKTTHPVLIEASVDFGSRAIKEIFPPGGPVKEHIPGEPTKDRLEKAQRKSRHMNWQLTRQIKEFRPSLEQLLSQLPMGGVQYQRWVYDARRKRAVVSFVPVDRMVIPSSATDFYSAERRTFIEDITDFEYEARVRNGVYAEINVLATGSMAPVKSKAETANDKIEGKTQSSTNKDGQRRVYEVEVEMDFEGEDKKAPKGVPVPYIVRIDDTSNAVLGLVRNWEEKDEATESMTWTVEWQFVPWRGALAIGLPQMIGQLAGGATGSLRALLDSAHVNNFPGLVKLKGSKQGGQSVTLQPTQVTEMEGGPGADDIRKLLMALPYNEPSPVLFSLLGFLVDAAKGVVRTTFEDLAEQKQDMPVGTTLALIEQGMAVMSAIHGRLYASMERTLAVLERINRMYITDEQIRDETGELLAKSKDYDGPADVIPVADPRIFSEVQRFAQMQVVAGRADVKPELYNSRKVELMILERLKFPNPEQLLVPPPDPSEMNAVNENVAATLGRPITAFPEQDHLAHIQAHVDYFASPFFGQLPPILMKYTPAFLTHMVEHITLWYASRVYEQASAAGDKDFSDLLKFKDPETRKEIDRVVALASSLVVEEATEVFAKIPPIIQQAMQIVQQLQQMNQPQDPSAQVLLAAENIKAQNRMQTTQITVADKKEDRMMRMAERLREINARVIEGGKKSEGDMRREQFRQMAESDRANQTNASREFMNTQDNETAMTIAEAEITSGEKADVSTGTGINPQAE